MAKKKDLGKGIRALLSNIETKQNVSQKETKSKTGVSSLAIKDIEANINQPRKEFEDEALQQLSDSIKEHGIIQPLTVRKISGNKYQLISGERRFRASKIAGLTEVPVYIREANDTQLLEMALIENIQREDLNAMEIAIGYNRLLEECDLNHEELALRVSKKRSTISNYLRLLKLPPQIQNTLISGKISMGHARALAGVEQLSRQLLGHKVAIDQGLSVRALERWIQNFSKPVSLGKSSSDDLPTELIKIRQELKLKFGSPVDINRSAKGKGKISFNFSNDKELNYILDLLNES